VYPGTIIPSFSRINFAPAGQGLVGWSTAPNGGGLIFRVGTLITVGYSNMDLFPVFGAHNEGRTINGRSVALIPGTAGQSADVFGVAIDSGGNPFVSKGTDGRIIRFNYREPMTTFPPNWAALNLIGNVRGGNVQVVIIPFIAQNTFVPLVNLGVNSGTGGDVSFGMTFDAFDNLYIPMPGGAAGGSILQVTRTGYDANGAPIFAAASEVNRVVEGFANVISIHIDGDGNLWAANSGGILRRYARTSAINAVIPTFSGQHTQWTIGGQIRGITSDSEGNIWVSSRSGGIFRLVRTGADTFSAPVSLVPSASEFIPGAFGVARIPDPNGIAYCRIDNLIYVAILGEYGLAAIDLHTDTVYMHIFGDGGSGNHPPDDIYTPFTPGSETPVVRLPRTMSVSTTPFGEAIVGRTNAINLITSRVRITFDDGGRDLSGGSLPAPIPITRPGFRVNIPAGNLQSDGAVFRGWALPDGTLVESGIWTVPASRADIVLSAQWEVPLAPATTPLPPAITDDMISMPATTAFHVRGTTFASNHATYGASGWNNLLSGRLNNDRYAETYVVFDFSDDPDTLANIKEVLENTDDRIEFAVGAYGNGGTGNQRDVILSVHLMPQAQFATLPAIAANGMPETPFTALDAIATNGAGFRISNRASVNPIYTNATFVGAQLVPGITTEASVADAPNVVMCLRDALTAMFEATPDATGFALTISGVPANTSAENLAHVDFARVQMRPPAFSDANPRAYRPSIRFTKAANVIEPIEITWVEPIFLAWDDQTLINRWFVEVKVNRPLINDERLIISVFDENNVLVFLDMPNPAEYVDEFGDFRYRSAFLPERFDENFGFGTYTIRAFVWEDMRTMNPLAWARW